MDLTDITLFFFDAYGATPGYALANLIVALAVLVGARALAGRLTGVRSLAEIHERDNPAFGISVAGLLIALVLLMSGAMYGATAPGLLAETGIMVGYAVLALALMIAATLSLDRLVLRGLCVATAIREANVAVGVVQAGNLVATALIIRSAMRWQEGYGLGDVALVMAAFVVSQALMLAVGAYRRAVYARRNDGAPIERALEGGNVALALRYTGHMVGMGLAITAAGSLADASGGLVPALLAWAPLAVIAAVAVSALAVILRHAVLAGVDVGDEVDRQRNVAVGAIEGALYLVAGLLLLAMFG